MLRVHQRRLRAGDDLPCFTDIARRSGIHRDTIYALLNGESVSVRTQYALSRVLCEIEQETRDQFKTRLLSVSLCERSPKLHIGLQCKPVLLKRDIA